MLFLLACADPAQKPDVTDPIEDTAEHPVGDPDVERFDEGATQVVWSSAGQIQRVTPEGIVTWQLDLDLGQATTFVQSVSSMYAAEW
ncbi:MAG: hypothetical protein Q8P18_30575 [Pseudomonadota bacterium]|nr:hypothetical protein [Pseudomonadota bacterium]